MARGRALQGAEEIQEGFCLVLYPISQPLSEEPMEVQGAERTAPEPQVPRAR